MQEGDINPIPRAIFINENVHENHYLHEGSELNNGGLSPHDRREFAKDYITDSKRKKIDNSNDAGNMNSSCHLLQNASDENIVVKIERDGDDDKGFVHQTIGSMSESGGPKNDDCLQPVGESEIKSETETDEAALLKYYLSNTSVHKTRPHIRESGMPQSSTSNPRSTNIRDCYEAAACDASENQPEGSQNSYAKKNTDTMSLESGNTSAPTLLTNGDNNVSSENSLLHDHVTTHSPDKRFSCMLCGKNFDLKGSLDQHLQTRAGQQSYQCHYCDKVFVHDCILKRHLRTHSGEKSYHCNTCSKNFSKYSALRVHKRTHTGEKPHVCPVCNKAFRQSSGLNVHKKTHEREKKYSCPVCNESFARPYHLKKHKRTHSAVRSIRGSGKNCPVCNMVVCGSRNLKEHMKTHVGEKSFVCGICSKAFMRSETLEVHMRKHTGENALMCFVCDTLFLSKSYLKQHMKTCH